MSAESPRHLRSGGPLTVPAQPPSDRSIIDAVSGFINDVTLSSSSNVDPKDVWLIPPHGEAQEVLSWRQGTVRVLRILPTPQYNDCFASKRPLIALCDSASPGPAFCEGVTSYTATVLHAAKSLSKGLRGLGESVAHSLAGGRTSSQSPSPPHSDLQQPGVVTVLDIESNEDEDSQDCEEPCDPIVAHFIAHSEAVTALKFDPSGMLLDIAISGDSRWTAISTLRGTTHVFAISPYGGACGVRTHTLPRVVNRLSRFHRSAGLPIHSATAHTPRCADMYMSEEERWLSQVEIVTHAGPHRRLWMGPQFVFKTYNCTGSNSSLSEAETVEVETTAVAAGGGGLAWEERLEVRDVRRSPGIVRAVDPIGTVVAPPVTEEPQHYDPDAYTRSNDDEAKFRPVVRAPAAPLPPDILIRPLPVTTTIPVQNISPLEMSPDDEPLPLKTDVVIPAELTRVRSWLPNMETEIAEPKMFGVSVSEERQREVANVVCLDRKNLENKMTNKDLECTKVRQNFSVKEKSERTLTQVEVKSDNVNISLPKCNRTSDDIQPMPRTRVKKNPTNKNCNDKLEICDNIKDKKSTESDLKKSEGTHLLREDPVNLTKVDDICRKNTSKSSQKSSPKTLETSESPLDKDSIDNTNLSLNQEVTFKNINKKLNNDIRTEEQAWDMLLSEPPALKPVVVTKNEPILFATLDKVEDVKPKSRKNRKIKKNQDELQSKEDDDSFIEIHAIEEKSQPSSGELVSISTTFEKFDQTTSFSSKIKSLQSSKRCTPDRTSDDSSSNTLETQYIDREDPKSSSPRLIDVKLFQDKTKTSSVVDPFIETFDTTLTVKEKHTGCKSKSPSPNFERRKSTDRLQDKEVFVINSTEEDYPEIQITKANKFRKKSPQIVDKRNKDDSNSISAKSWSSIAASNTKKSVEHLDEMSVIDDVTPDDEQKNDVTSGSRVSLQEKLFELCKRTDIMVAECDAPSELNFVEEHHSAPDELPPLEPLDFALDDFKLEVMKDSLIDVNETKLNSPICKINIDEILSSMNSKKSSETACFSLIDVHNTPARKEKGFSVVETEKITSEDIRIDDEMKDKCSDVMDKSSDDDGTSPVVSTDSDKDERKNMGASSVPLPSPKQTKPKKSRRKRK
ncbi:unnamed protein product [Leptidea sinapis]|uniref:Uncharacterized protein n=1 Tax=Leptidea sinapis TaxID=189913 RepID=A0A5E4Q1U3_9NEOP|nr:unnamed protein product [Leptidea sinapis]